MSKRFILFKNPIRGFYLNLTKNKNIEVEFMKSGQWFYLSTGINQGDHWGVDFRLSLLKYEFSFIFYDSRHRDEL